MTDWVALRVPAAAYAVGVARTMVVAAADDADLEPSKVHDIRLAVSEAVTNAVQAHRRIQSTSPVIVRVATEGDRFVIEVGDAGPGLVDVDAGLPDTGSVDDLPEGGFGLPVMRALADEVDIREGGIIDPKVGTTVRLAFHRVAAV